MDERGEALRGLVIAGGEAAKLLQSAEEDLDEVALLEQVPVVLGLDSPRGMRPNHRPDAAPFQHVADALRVVCRVAEKDLAVSVIDQRFRDGCFVPLTWRELDVERLTESAHESVDLGRKTASRPANIVSVDPPFPPAACWCALTIVASAMEPSGSTSTRSSSKTRFQTPESAKRRKRL